eukprot:s158_g12.t2
MQLSFLVGVGGTVLACREELAKRGAKKVSVFVTHGVFPLGSWKKFEGAGFEKIFITDSVPETCEIFREHQAARGESSTFEIIGLAPALHEYLQGQVDYAAREAWRK